jgi:hypothetical protein
MTHNAQVFIVTALIVCQYHHYVPGVPAGLSGGISPGIGGSGGEPPGGH